MHYLPRHKFDDIFWLRAIRTSSETYHSVQLTCASRNSSGFSVSFPIYVIRSIYSFVWSWITPSYVIFIFVVYFILCLTHFVKAYVKYSKEEYYDNVHFDKVWNTIVSSPELIWREGRILQHSINCLPLCLYPWASSRKYIPVECVLFYPVHKHSGYSEGSCYHPNDMDQCLEKWPIRLCL